MNLRRLLQHFPSIACHGPKDVEISGICMHSKRVAPKNLFVAKSDLYVQEAIDAGASAILSDFYNPFLKGVTQLVHPGGLEAKLAATFYGHPSKKLFTVGITGTNGKTTTSYLVRHLLGESCGLVGTIEYITKEHRYPAQLTTPETTTLQKLLAEMDQAVVMEVSSIGIDQGRVDEIDFDVAIFTNLTQDHLDYHKTMETYVAVKAKFFAQLGKEKVVLLCCDDPYHKQMETQARTITYGFSPKANLRISEMKIDLQGTTFTLHFDGKSQTFSSPMLGRHNVLNCAAALGVKLSQGTSLASLSCDDFPPIPGRLERVCSSPSIFVDFAHTPDALEKTLATLREVTRGKIYTVVGCGGDRDPLKRPSMGKAAEEGSDHVILTSDNPRSEDPQTICEQMAQGFSQKDYTIDVDRAQAIAQAIERAGDHDLILIAGKGHERTQIFAHQTIPFDDREIAKQRATR